MTRNIVNFNAGPAGLPESALLRARDELLDFEGTGMSIIEHSHREKAYERVHGEAKTLVRELLGVPGSHDILLVQGGASQLFATVPMNFLPRGRVADYILTGAWSKKAFEEAKNVGEARVAGTGEVNGQFVRIPSQGELDLRDSAAYVHVTSNNTIFGTQYRAFPSTGPVPLIADMSSDIMSRRLDVSKFGLIYAGAQKNLGPAGIVLVVIDRELMARGATNIPTIFRFKAHAESDSLYNTPPTFGIYILRNVLAWVKEIGGLGEVSRRNLEKATALYDAIDQSGGYYRSPVEVPARSEMNVIFRLPSEDLEKRFVAESEKIGLVGLKGHRSAGGIRASIYNAVTIEGVERLTAFMKAFHLKNG